VWPGLRLCGACLALAATLGASYGFAQSSSNRFMIDPALEFSGAALGFARDVAVDEQGFVYITGQSGNNGYVAKLSPDGSDLVYRTLFTAPGAGASAFAIAVDDEGSAYITGAASDADFPTTPGAFDETFNGVFDAFVAKLSPDGSKLEYSTFLGGSDGETGFGIDVDARGDAYVTGNVFSDDFPTTPGAYDRTHGPFDTFVAKLNESGTALEYSTFLWNFATYGFGDIAVDAAGSAYVTGVNDNIVTTPGAFDTEGPGQFEAADDAFVTKLSPNGGGLAYSTYLGGTSDDTSPSIDVGRDGTAHVSGFTRSPDFPTTEQAHDGTPNGGVDGFATKLNPDGSALLYSTYLGGEGNDGLADIAVAPDGGSVLAGRTESESFPLTADAFQRSLSGQKDVVVVRLGPSGSLEYSTLLGGVEQQSTFDEFAAAVATDRDADAYVAGYSNAPDFPSTPGVYEPHVIGGFVAKLATSAAPCGARVTGSGSIVTDERRRASFQISVKVASDRAKGRVRYRESASGFGLRSSDITRVSCPTPNSVTLFGIADGTPFRVDIADGGQPGRGNDTFRLLADGKDTGTQALTSGNLTVR
jgi:Beta-propeller repeat